VRGTCTLDRCSIVGEDTGIFVLHVLVQQVLQLLRTGFSLLVGYAQAREQKEDVGPGRLGSAMRDPEALFIEGRQNDFHAQSTDTMPREQLLRLVPRLRGHAGTALTPYVHQHPECLVPDRTGHGGGRMLQRLILSARQSTGCAPAAPVLTRRQRTENTMGISTHTCTGRSRL
jgi:hypothetical protein